MQYITIFHANLNYAYLTEDRYEFVIRRAYEMTLDTMQAEFPDVPFVFEASGYTLEHMAQKTPDVLEKLKAAIARGQCEFMGSPYAHPMLPNFPQADGLWSIRFSNEVYERLLGFRPRSFWNPECGWRSYVPAQVVEAGYTNMIGDFEAYSRSCGPDGRPLRPEIYAAEYSREPAFYNFNFKYDLPGTEKAIHFPFDKVHGLPADRLRLFLRTDRLAQFGVRYFMGMDGYTLEKYLDLVRKYSEQPAGETEGAVIIFADDAEYIGTNGWFRLKFQNQPDNVFEATPASRQKLIDLISAVRRLGRFVTFDQACRTLPPLPEEIRLMMIRPGMAPELPPGRTHPWPAYCGPGKNWCAPGLPVRRWMTKPKKWPGSISPIPTTPTANGRPPCRRRRTLYILTITPTVLRICCEPKCW